METTHSLKYYHLSTSCVYNIPVMKQFVIGVAILLVALIAATSFLLLQRTDFLPSGGDTPLLDTPAATTIATAVNFAPEAVASDADLYFEIEQRVTSKELPDIVLAVRSAERLPDALALMIAFENSTDEPIEYSFISGLDAAFVRLSDADGNQYEPLEVASELVAIQPEGGFAPGGANVGQLRFPLPEGAAPYRLSGLFDFDAVEFGLENVSAPPPPLAVPSGEYLAFVRLFSDHEILAPLGLNVNRIWLQEETISFDVAFVNTTFRNFGLRSGPTGADAWLIDADGRQYRPLDVSESLAMGITPAGGLAPDGQQAGTITFARPRALQELRFVFREYTPLALRFDEQGLLDAQLASSADGVPLAAPTPHPEVVVYSALDDLLARQADAIAAKDATAYLETLTPALVDAQQVLFDRLARMPFASFGWELDRKHDFSAAQSGELIDVKVRLRYQLAGIPDDNDFIHDFRMDFRQGADGWRLTRVDALENPPFWWGGDFVFYDTAHFILFARPHADLDVGLLQEEVEGAYATLVTKGLPLESRYVAYITAAEDNFSLLTGMAGERYLGVAYSRFNIENEQIEVVSRAIYLNGSQFAEQAISGERQSTITHELVHLAFAHDSRPYTPIWLVEGLAVYYAEQASAVQRQHLWSDGQLEEISLDQLSHLESLGEHDLAGESTSYRYIYSGATIQYLIETFGEDALRNFYRSYTQVPIDEVRQRMADANSGQSTTAAFADLSRQVTDKNLLAFFGMDLNELDAQVKAWVVAGE